MIARCFISLNVSKLENPKEIKKREENPYLSIYSIHFSFLIKQSYILLLFVFFHLLKLEAMLSNIYMM